MKSITVLMITYNQEHVIGRAFDSILQQKDWGLKEIVVCDDCSTDNNWEVIQKYVAQNQGIIRAYRNNPNLGIYKNLEKAYSLRGSADMFVMLAGDDAMSNGYFQKIQDAVIDNNIDVDSDTAAICFDFSVRRPNGSERIIKTNKYLELNVSPFRLKFRGLVHSRGIVVTNKVMEKYINVPDGISTTLAESISEIQFFTIADKICYCPFVANYYYSQIGISTTMRNKDHYKKDEEKWDYLLEHLELCKKDRYYAMMRKNLLSYAYTPSYKKMVNIINYYILSRDKEIPFNFLNYFFNIRLILKATFLHAED